MPDASRVELVLAHPTGIVEIAEGDVDAHRIRLRSTVIGRTDSAKAVTAIERDFMIAGDTLQYSLRMEAMGRPMTEHLRAELHRS
jgi:THAP4-like, heme-binding beta-barrel domain